jgi:putative transposase
VVKQVDNAFQRFFRRVRNGQKAGYPRFKGRNQFHSFEFKQFGKSGAFLDGRRLNLFGIGRVRVRWHRPIDGTIKTVRIVHKAGRWYACFACEVATPESLKPTSKVIGIDMGITVMLTTSDGAKEHNPKYYRAGQARLRRLQRKLARTKRGSNNRQKVLKQVQRQQEHVANQRSDYLHKLSYKLIKHYGKIAIENLRINNMIRNHRLSKSILDSSWGIFKEFLTYKAESAGREIFLVEPAYTSQRCSNPECGKVFQEFDLSTRRVTCDCGLSLDRDHNAAINILSRAGWVTSVNGNVAPLPSPNGEGKGRRRSEAHTL